MNERINQSYGISARQGKRITVFVFALLTLFPFVQKAQNTPAKNNIEMLLLTGDYNNAVAAIKTALKTEPGNADLYYKLGLAYKKLSRPANSASALEICLKIDSANAPASLLLADTYQTLGINDKAFNIYRTIYDADSSNLTAGLNIGSMFIDNEDYAGALNIYRRVSRLDSLNGFIFRQIGFCYSKMDSLPRAMVYFLKAVNINNNDLNSFRQLINTYIKMGAFNAAEAAVLMKMRRDTLNPLLNKLIGEAYFGLKNYSKAAHCYQIAANGGDSTAYTFSKLGVSYFLLAGESDSAKPEIRDSCYRLSREALEKSVKKENSAVNCYFLAMTNQRLKEYEASIDYFDGAVKLIVPNIMHDLYVHQSESFVSLKLYLNAIEALKAALFYKKDDYALMLGIADLYEKELQDYPNAIGFYTEYFNKSQAEPNEKGKIRQKILKLTKSIKQ